MNNENAKNILKVIFASISAFMTFWVILTSLKSDMFHLSPAVLNEPWFTTSLIDFYFNIFIISAWVVYRERALWRAVLWIMAFVTLGSIASAFYVFMQLLGLKEGEGFEKALLRKTA